MKGRILFFAAVLVWSCLRADAQVLNTGQTLKPLHFSLGAYPLLIIAPGALAPGLYLCAGAGIVPGLDASLFGRLSNSMPFIGGDIEWRLLSGMPSLSLSTGAYGNRLGVGASVNLNLTFPLRRIADLYLGPKFNVFFSRERPDFPFWIFAGAEFRCNQHLSIPVEVDIGIPPDRPHIIASGLVVYF